MKRAVALIDGEHYPNVVREALEELALNYELKAAVFIGGMEKIDTETVADADRNEYGVPVIFDDDPFRALAAAIDEYRPQTVVDLSDEPVLGYVERFRFASFSLAAGAEYQGADFTLLPPTLHKLSVKPSISIIGTGKRIGKTAISGYLAREISDSLAGQGYVEGIVIVAMGRGGPTEPEVIPGREQRIGVRELLEISRQGRHAASDYLEDAALSWVTTIGCRRCGGGLAGMPFVSNVVEGARIAETLACDLVLFEGSGAALPPVKADRVICVAGADQPDDYLLGYLGTYRMLIADMVILTMCEEPMASAGKIARIVSGIREINPVAEVVTTVLRPRPAGDIAGRRVAYFTTAQGEVTGHIAAYLAETYGCTVDFVSSSLADRARLRRELESLPVDGVDVFLTEIKAAAVDVVAEEGERRGVEVVFCDNVPVETDGSGRLPELVAALAAGAMKEFGGSDE